MTKELKTCPFQKEGEVHELEWVDVGALKWLRCKTCNAQGPCDESKERARELWNTRYKRTCHNIGDYDKDEEFKCSECGHIDRLFEYSPEVGEHCKGCGAEVVDG